MNLIDDFFASTRHFYFQQVKELTEILIDWETTNRYQVMNDQQQAIGYVAERPGGLWKKFLRFFLRSHRGFQADVLNEKGERLMWFDRPFYWFWSTMSIYNAENQLIGTVERKFGFLIMKKYELMTREGRVFATINTPIWRLWKFKLLAQDREVGHIQKKWGGFLKEAFTDADRFMVDMGNRPWTLEQKMVMFATTISVDFDYFENNSNSAMSFFD